MKRSILVCLMAAACGGATGTDKQGPPLVTLHGQLTGTAGASTTGPVSVAIAWYPALASNGATANPKAIVTQQVTFQGNFPVDFSLQLDGPPPDDAMVDLAANGGVGKAAYGALLAFEDRNGNGTLDLVPLSGGPIDKIVGSSIGDPSLVQPAITYSIQYLDGTPGLGDELDVLGAAQGYNLMQAHYEYGVEPVPLDTSIAIPITGTPALDILACPADLAPSFATACGIDPYDGGYSLFADVFTNDGQPSSIALSIFRGSGFADDAIVDFDGTPIPDTGTPDNSIGFNLSGVSGSGTLHVSVPGYPPESIPITVLPQLTVTMPASMKAGSDLALSWNPVDGIEFYDVIVSDATSPTPPKGKTLLHQLVNATQTTIPAVPAGTISVRIAAVGNPSIGPSPNSYVQSISLGGGTVTVSP
jgi:hypothetical protein